MTEAEHRAFMRAAAVETLAVGLWASDNHESYSWNSRATLESERADYRAEATRLITEALKAGEADHG